jgi:hypothetical protein
MMLACDQTIYRRIIDATTEIKKKALTPTRVYLGEFEWHDVRAMAGFVSPFLVDEVPGKVAGLDIYLVKARRHFCVI